MVVVKRFNKNVVAGLRRGGIAVIPTDTIYGVVGSAFSRTAVERIYRLRRRNVKKPMIVLLASVRELSRFGVRVDAAIVSFLHRVWPGKVSVILPVKDKRFAYLHRGTSTLAFRIPPLKSLRALLKKTGPLVAPSANPEGKSPARTVNEAREYFGDDVDIYVDKGKCPAHPSTVVALRWGRITLVRRGSGNTALRQAGLKGIIHP